MSERYAAVPVQFVPKGAATEAEILERYEPEGDIWWATDTKKILVSRGIAKGWVVATTADGIVG